MLLDEYAIATISSGRLLLEQLGRSRRKDSNNRLLVIGDVAYDARKEAPRPPSSASRAS